MNESILAASIVAGFSCASSVVAGLILRHLRKLDAMEKTAAESRDDAIKENRNAIDHHADSIFIITRYLRELERYGLPRFFDKD